MSRYVWPYVFTLRAAGLMEALRQEKTAKVREYYPKSAHNAIPAALRWSTIPSLGFPREPFQVFRRQRGGRVENKLFEKAIAESEPIVGERDLSVFAKDLAYVVIAKVTVSSGNSLTLQALDATGRAIPGQSAAISKNGTVEFRCPGIAALRASGFGSIGPVFVIPESAYANLPDWQKIQTVGLPLQNHQADAYYRTLPQGFEPATLDGVRAAELRTAITAALQVNPPPTGLADFPLPPWPTPNPSTYVSSICSPKSIVPMIVRCLEHSVDSDLSRMQVSYIENITIDGIKQANLPGAQADPSMPTSARLPVTGVAMMAVSTDSYSAVALGYGTVDIPPLAEAGAASESEGAVQPGFGGFGTFDYMVTAPFTIPAGPHGLTFTLAALSTGEPPVEAAPGLIAEVKQVHAPLWRNQAAQAAIKVSWQPSAVPQGYGILVSRAPNQSEVLNASRPPAVRGYDPFVGLAPMHPDPNLAPDQQLPNFVDTGCELPLKGAPIHTRYLVAGLNVFGLWSNWSLAEADLSPAAIIKPGIRNAGFLMDVDNASGHLVPATMRIEFAWDWQDRAPGQIRFTGQFVTPGSTLGPAYLAGLAMENSGAAGPPVILTFNYTSPSQADTVAPNVIVPAIDSGHSADVQMLISTSSNPDNQQVQYRVDISGVTLDFSSANELDFALYVTATEEIRPGEWSDAADPVMKYVGKIVRSYDPIAPDVTFAPPSINWTALPDVIGIARGILKWTPDPKAAGYYVWEATESALWHILSPNTPDPAPNTPLVTRGASLKTLIQNNEDESLQAFARLNKDPIQGSRTEICVPAAASTLYVYRISAISAGNVESARSSEVAIFGVPRRNIPGTPRLMLRAVQSPQPCIQVIALPVGSGALPAGYRVYRVRNASLSLDGSTMGPVKIGETDAGWEDYSSSTLAGTPLNGKSIVDTAALTSWYPYYYRIKAIGQQDLANGLYGGESGFSNAQAGYVLPANPPLIQSPVLNRNVNAALVTLTTDLPAAASSPVGPALVEVVQLISDPMNPARMTTKTILSSAPEAIIAGSLSLPAVPPPPLPPSPPPHHPVYLPHLPFPGGQATTQPHPIPPVPTPAMRRSTPDASGQWTLYVLIPYTLAEQNTFMVRLTDPQARMSSYSF